MTLVGGWINFYSPVSFRGARGGSGGGQELVYEESGQGLGLHRASG